MPKSIDKQDVQNCRLLLAFLENSFRGATINNLKIDALIQSLKNVLAASQPIDRAENIMNQKELDDFLDNATHAVANLYCKTSGEQLQEKELYALNDLITEFFQRRKQ
jgi:hypothetical protein